MCWIGLILSCCLLVSCSPLQNFGQGVFGELSGVNGSGNVLSKQRPVGRFEKMRISSGLDLDFTQNSEENYRLMIEADENLHDLILTEVFSGTLVVRTSTRQSVAQAQAKRLILSGPLMPELELRQGSGANLTLNGGQLNLTLLESANAILKGNLEQLVLMAGNTSQMDAIELTIQDVDATLTDSAGVQLGAVKNLDYDLQDQAELRYSGDPELKGNSDPNTQLAPITQATSENNDALENSEG